MNDPERLYIRHGSHQVPHHNFHHQRHCSCNPQYLPDKYRNTLRIEQWLLYFHKLLLYKCALRSTPHKYPYPTLHQQPARSNADIRRPQELREMPAQLRSNPKQHRNNRSARRLRTHNMILCKNPLKPLH